MAKAELIIFLLALSLAAAAILLVGGSLPGIN